MPDMHCMKGIAKGITYTGAPEKSLAESIYTCIVALVSFRLEAAVMPMRGQLPTATCNSCTVQHLVHDTGMGQT